MTTSRKINKGILNGLAFKTRRLSIMILIPQRKRSAPDAKMIRSCFGIVIKSVEEVKKNRGSKNTVIEIRAVDKVSSKAKACFVFICSL